MRNCFSGAIVETLGVSLSTVGLSEAKGVQLVATREQIDGTLPRGQGASSPEELKPRELTPEERRVVRELEAIDRKVREHETAHLRNGAGVVTSGANYSFTYGPDGKQYAVAGEVGIDTSPERKPEDNIDKGQRIQSAALAPRDPSPTDYRVAAVGGRLEAQGRSDLSAQQAQERVEATVRDRSRREEEAQQQNLQRGEAVAVQAEATGEAQNVEPVAPAAKLNDAARQRLTRTYAPPQVSAAGVSLFA